jgi:hypothetical protein
MARCDWANDNHGAMRQRIRFEGNEKHIVIVAYNKVYHGFLLMGGGLSYDIKLSIGKMPVLNVRDFVRANRQQMGFVAYVSLERTEGGLRVRKVIGESRLRSGLARFVRDRIAGPLAAEEDASVQLLETP